MRPSSDSKAQRFHAHSRFIRRVSGRRGSRDKKQDSVEVKVDEASCALRLPVTFEVCAARPASHFMSNELHSTACNPLGSHTGTSLLPASRTSRTLCTQDERRRKDSVDTRRARRGFFVFHQKTLSLEASSTLRACSLAEPPRPLHLLLHHRGLCVSRSRRRFDCIADFAFFALIHFPKARDTVS